MKFKIKDDKKVEPEVVVGIGASTSLPAAAGSVHVYAHPAGRSGPLPGDFILRINPEGTVTILSGFTTGKEVGFQVDSHARVIVEGKCCPRSVQCRTKGW